MKTIIISGGNRGIGLEICRQLDAMGHTVILGSRDPKKGREASAEWSKKLIVKRLDVTEEESIMELYAFVREEFGSLDVLINNAGLGSTHFKQKAANTGKLTPKLKENIPGFRQFIKIVKPVLKKGGMLSNGNKASQIPLDGARFLMETNLYGPWRMAQVFSPLLKKAGEGRIINISSGMGELRSLKGDYPAYRMSKAALNALTIMLADEFGPGGISVNAMCPGWVRTDMGGPDALGTVEEGADTAVWLATDDKIEKGKFYRDRKIIDW